MKYITILIATFSFFSGYSQFVTFYSNKDVNDSAELYLLYSDGHYKTLAKQISSRKIELGLSYPIFASLRYKGHEKTLLLRPESSLSITYDSSSKSLFLINGSGKTENLLLERIDFGDQPYYLKRDSVKLYARLTYDSLKSYFIPSVNNKIKSDSIVIFNSRLPIFIKNLIYDEYRSSVYCNLYYLIQNEMRWARNPFQEQNLDYILKLQSDLQSVVPISRIRNGFYYNLMLENQQQYFLLTMAKELKKDKAIGRKKIESYLGMSFDSINSKVEYFGERNIITWLASKNNFPNEVSEKMLFNKIIESYENGRIRVASSLTDTFYRYYPKSNYNNIIASNLIDVSLNFEKNKENKNIRIHENRVSSLDDLIKPFLGKVIYLDIWGSWCGPCLSEMKLVKELHDRFADKEVVFLYLAFDQDKSDKDWREAIYFYNLNGDHYRVTDEIKNYWKKIKDLGGESESFPTYLIIDKAGQVVNVNAKRPSDKVELYNEINRYLK
jgi:thiol-disulfide isomerase/thioredoxin